MQSNIEVARARNALPGTCTICGSLAVFIIESRLLPNGGRRRRKHCQRCGDRRTTYEISQEEYRALRFKARKHKDPQDKAQRHMQPKLSCQDCLHWETTDCGLGFPEAGGIFAAECSCYVTKEDQQRA
jgi:hypothetical protein